MIKRKRIRRELWKVKEPEVKERLLMVQVYHSGQTFQAVGQQFGCSFNKVKFWKDRYDQGGLVGLETRIRSGRPRKLSDKLYNKLKTEVNTPNQGWDTRQIRQIIKQRAGVLYSERQVQRITARWGLSLQVGRPIYAHTDEQERRRFLKKIVKSSRI